MKASTLLQRSKKYLWDGKGDIDDQGGSMFICWAVTDASRDHFGADIKGQLIENKIVSHINRALGSHGSVTNWLESRSKEFRAFHKRCFDGNGCQDRREEFYTAVQAYRRAWIDRLITEFKAKGD